MFCDPRSNPERAYFSYASGLDFLQFNLVVDGDRLFFSDMRVLLLAVENYKLRLRVSLVVLCKTSLPLAAFFEVDSGPPELKAPVFSFFVCPSRERPKFFFSDMNE